MIPFACNYLLFTFRNDSSHSNLRTAAYEALMDLIKYSPKVIVIALLLFSISMLCAVRLFKL